MRQFAKHLHGWRWLPIVGMRSHVSICLTCQDDSSQSRLRSQPRYRNLIEAVGQEPEDAQATSAAQLYNVFTIFRL